MNDLRFAIRRLRASPGFTLVVVLTLALGLGANTAIFSVVNTVLLKPLPYPEPERLVMVCESNLKMGWAQDVTSSANFFDWKEQCGAFEALAATRFDNFSLSGVEPPERLLGAQITPGFFEVFKVPPLLGRVFQGHEYETNGPRTIVLSEHLWRRKFSGDPGMIGKAITINGRPHTVLGVMPAGFRFFHPTTVEGWPAGLRDADVWRPAYSYVDPAMRSEDRGEHWLLVLGRLKREKTLADARNELNGVMARIHQTNPEYKDWSVSVTPLHDQVVAKIRPGLLALLSAAIGVLLMVCANLANLSLSRAAARQKEFAIRAALGGSGGRVIHQLLAESLLLAALGGAGGCLLAAGGTKALLAFSPPEITQAGAIAWDWRVFTVTFLAATLTGVAFGLAPALGLVRLNLSRVLAEGGRGGSAGTGASGLRNALVVFQVALALMLLAAAGLLGRSFAKLRQMDPGFKAEQLVAVDISLVDRKYNDPLKRVEFLERFLPRIQALPGVTAAGTIYGLPLGSMLYGQFRFEIEGRPPPAGQVDVADVRQISSGYLAAMGIPLVSGRGFSTAERTNSPAVVVVNEALARKYFPAVNPVGQRIRLGDGWPNPAEIIGVARDAKPLGLDRPTPPEAYRSHAQACDWYLSLVVRTAEAPARIADAIRREIRAVDADRAIYNIRAMDQAVAESLAARRFVMSLVVLFALAALVIGAVGIYGVVAFSVATRTREIGIRLALGALPANVRALILGQGMRLAAKGVLLGLLGFGLLQRLVAHQLFGVTTADPVTLGGMLLLILLTTGVACWLPARRAAQVDPMVTLRSGGE